MILVETRKKVKWEKRTLKDQDRLPHLTVQGTGVPVRPSALQKRAFSSRVSTPWTRGSLPVCVPEEKLRVTEAEQHWSLCPQSVFPTETPRDSPVFPAGWRAGRGLGGGSTEDTSLQGESELSNPAYFTQLVSVFVPQKNNNNNNNIKIEKGNLYVYCCEKNCRIKIAAYINCWRQRNIPSFLHN